MQLQQHLAEFDAAGIALFAISYDSVEEQRKFADEFDITFPLLADPEHRAIETTGILNTLVRPDEPEAGPAPARARRIPAPRAWTPAKRGATRASTW